MKSKTIAILLTFFLGGFGIQKFYLGKAGQGVLCLVFCWTLIPAFIAFIDFFRLAFMSIEKFNRYYNPRDIYGR